MSSTVTRTTIASSPLLGRGTADTKGVTAVEPQDVADGIVEALQLGIVDVHVPKSVKRISKVTAFLPRRASEGIARALKADRVLFEADPNASLLVLS